MKSALSLPHLFSFSFFSHTVVKKSQEHGKDLIRRKRTKGGVESNRVRTRLSIWQADDQNRAEDTRGVRKKAGRGDSGREHGRNGRGGVRQSRNGDTGITAEGKAAESLRFVTLSTI